MKKRKGWRNEPLRHSLASKGVKTGSTKPFKYRGVTIKKGQKLYVGELGEVIVTYDSNDIPVHYVREESGVKSWQLNVERSDVVLATVYAKRKGEITKSDLEKAELDSLVEGGWVKKEKFRRLKAGYKTQENLK